MASVMTHVQLNNDTNYLAPCHSRPEPPFNPHEHKALFCGCLGSEASILLLHLARCPVLVSEPPPPSPSTLCFLETVTRFLTLLPFPLECPSKITYSRGFKRKDMIEKVELASPVNHTLGCPRKLRILCKCLSPPIMGPGNGSLRTIPGPVSPAFSHLLKLSSQTDLIPSRWMWAGGRVASNKWVNCG